jgi:hypothetical protein
MRDARSFLMLPVMAARLQACGEERGDRIRLGGLWGGGEGRAHQGKSFHSNTVPHKVHYTLDTVAIHACVPCLVNGRLKSLGNCSGVDISARPF